MKKRKIVADSSCDLFALEHTDFACASMKVITEQREFIDDASLDVDAMVDYLDGYKGKSKSSCPNLTDWLDAFGDADEVFCVTITGGLSGSYNSACAAKTVYEADDPDRRVFVLDSFSAGPEITLVLQRLEEMVGSELTFDEICSSITEYRERMGLVFMLKSLKTFANNGRVSPFVARLVGIAGICIVGKASDEGTLEPMHKCRGEKKSLEVLADTLSAEGYRSGKVRIGHCRNEEAAERLKQLILRAYEKADVEIHPLRGLCSFYAEKGGILVGFEKE